MKIIQVIWSDESLVDLEIIHEFLYEKSSVAASKVLHNILSRTRQLEEFPGSGAIEPTIKKGFQYRYLVEGNYKIIYRIAGEALYIVTVFDSRKSPDSLKL